MRIILLIQLFLISVAYSCGYGETFPVYDSAGSFFFMTATVSHIEKGDTIIYDDENVDTTEMTANTDTALLRLPSEIPIWNEKFRTRNTPAKLTVTPDSGSPLLPINAPLYLAFYGPGHHNTSNPYPTLPEWQVGDKLFIITSTWFQDSTGEVQIPIYHHRGSAVLRKIEEGDQSFSILSPQGVLSTDSAIALSQLIIQCKKESTFMGSIQS